MKDKMQISVALFVGFVAVASSHCSSGRNQVDGSTPEAGGNADTNVYPRDLSEPVDDFPAPPPVEEMGKGCPMGCNATLCADTASKHCNSKICVWDGRFGIDSYCSMSCATSSCPTGWACFDASYDRFCFKATCGNKEIDDGESCDTGSNVGTLESGCAKDCKGHISGGSVSLKVDGDAWAIDGTSESLRSEGMVKVKTTYHAASEATIVSAAFDAGINKISISFHQSDLQGPLPKQATGNIWLCGMDCPFNSEEASIIIESWDGKRRIKGSFDATMVYGGSQSLPGKQTRQITDGHFDILLLP